MTKFEKKLRKLGNISFDEHLEKLLSDPETKKAYDDLEPQFQAIRAILDKRIAKKMSQKQLAEKMGTKQSAVARLESPNSNPSIKSLHRVAKALDSKLVISFQ